VSPNGRGNAAVPQPEDQCRGHIAPLQVVTIGRTRPARQTYPARGRPAYAREPAVPTCSCALYQIADLEAIDRVAPLSIFAGDVPGSLPCCTGGVAAPRSGRGRAGAEPRM